VVNTVTVRILIADDSAILRKALRAALESRAQWQVIGEAVNGRDAVRQAVELAPDLIILDLTMPELDGLSAARQIRKRGTLAEILVVSYHDSQEVLRQAMDAGVRGYVAKNDLANDLFPAVEAVCKHRRFLSRSVSRI
jgi:DNA-binding NarL/FixJ family response regulator